MNRKKVLVLGAGMIGKAIARDLCNDFVVTCADKNKSALSDFEVLNQLSTVQLDFNDKESLRTLIASNDLIVGAVPGFMGFNVLKTVIEQGKNVVDISFFNEDPFLLDAMAKQMNVTAVVDCGVAPGLSNIFLGYQHQRMVIDSFECLVGGLPKKRVKPFEYKAPFSPVDVIEEYTRPARFVVNNKMVTREALSEPELINFEQTGTLEAFNTDGLRTLIKTIPIPNMIERTLRYPGHIDLIRNLRDAGFFSTDEIKAGGQLVRPIDLTAALLFRHWHLEPTEEEFTIMRVRVQGKNKERPVAITYELYDEYDNETKTSSMARTTGYTCTAVARLVAENKFNQKGIVPPEFVGADETAFQFIINYLKSKRIQIITKP